MREIVAVVGLDEPETQALAALCDARVVAYESVPPTRVEGGRLWLAAPSGGHELPIRRVILHGIFEQDFDFIAALAMWGGPCLPGAVGMLDCRLRLPGLIRALRYTRFAAPARGVVTAQMPFTSPDEHVAKWGDWHCGENKARFRGEWRHPSTCIIEPFLSGQAVRVVRIGEQGWQIRLGGDDWLQSIHHPSADFMELDDDLHADTITLQTALGLEVLATDYIVTPAGTKHLLEVNRIPNVTRFPELRAAYLAFAAAWCAS